MLLVRSGFVQVRAGTKHESVPEAEENGMLATGPLILYCVLLFCLYVFCRIYFSDLFESEVEGETPIGEL